MSELNKSFHDRTFLILHENLALPQGSVASLKNIGYFSEKYGTLLEVSKGTQRHDIQNEVN